MKLKFSMKNIIQKTWTKYIVGVLLLSAIITTGILLTGSSTKLQVDSRYLIQVLDQKKIACYNMYKLGYNKPSKVNKIDIIPGTTLRPLGWAIFDKHSPTKYVGGYTLGSTIVLVSDPNTGAILDSSIRHEWCESILDANGFVGSLDDRHVEINKAERLK